MIKDEWRKYSTSQKIAFVLSMIIFVVLILGSIGGLAYLFDSKKIPRANAEEIVGGTTEGNIISSAVVPFTAEYYLAGGYNSPTGHISSGNYVFNNPLIFSTENNVLSLQARSMGGYIKYTLPLTVGSAIDFPLFAPSPDDDVYFYLKCTSKTLTSSSFGSLYSVLGNYIAGTNELLAFEVTNIDGYTVSYTLEPYRAEEFGDFIFNGNYMESYRWLIIANNDYNFTERLNEAKQESYDNGYNRGFDEGKEYGYNVGYNEGANDSNKYTFGSLLNAVFYAPLKAFISVFNFEILGVNMLNIVSFFVSMLLAIGIIRMVL